MKFTYFSLQTKQKVSLWYSKRFTLENLMCKQNKQADLLNKTVSWIPACKLLTVLLLQAHIGYSRCARPVLYSIKSSLCSRCGSISFLIWSIEHSLKARHEWMQVRLLDHGWPDERRLSMRLTDRVYMHTNALISQFVYLTSI